jgi:hypothetical protein
MNIVPQGYAIKNGTMMSVLYRLVAMLREQEVGSSNLLIPTKKAQRYLVF